MIARIPRLVNSASMMRTTGEEGQGRGGLLLRRGEDSLLPRLVVRGSRQTDRPSRGMRSREGRG